MVSAGPDVVVVGSLNQDLVVRVPRHPLPGETVLGTNHFTGLGGKGANQAFAASRLGARVAMIGRVGDDASGAGLIETLDAAGVDTSEVARDASLDTGLAVITVDDRAENAIVVSPGANSGVTSSDIEGARAVIEASAVLLAQLEVPAAAVARAVQLAAGVVILNPAPVPREPLSAALLDAVDVLVPNRTELAALAGVETPGDPHEVAAAVTRLPFAGDVVVTLGAGGALLVTGGETIHVAAPEVDAVDTTGAGDAFCGALAEALARGAPLEAAVRWAVAAGAFAVTGLGAQGAMPTVDEVRSILSGG